jgi:hypothetical protein
MRSKLEKEIPAAPRLFCLAVAGLISALAVAAASAQTTAGSFVGRVTDPGGSVVSGATVTLRNEATNVAQTLQSNQTGDYTFSSVQPGVYELRVTAGGFQSQVLDHLNLDIQQTLREDFHLAVGSTTTSVQVTAQTPLIETDSTYVGSIVDGKQIEQTPLNGRENAYSLLGLAPGVQRPNSNALISGGSFKGGANQTIDGISNDDIVNARMSDQVPSLEDIAEFNTIGVDAPAEYGNGGAQVVIVTKSGTNDFHGSAFEFNRNRYFQARNFFLRPGSPIPAFNRNEYGFSLGGPLLRNRLFFFSSFENIHSLTTVTRGYAMPPGSWLSGDFSQYTSVGGKPTIVYDPQTGKPFPGNQIPADRISPVAKKFLRFFSAPNTATVNGLGNNFTYSSPNLELDPRFSIRFDYQATAKDHLMFRFYNNLRDPAPFDVGGTDKFGNYKKLGNDINQYAGNYTRTISNSMVNELVLGLNQRTDPRIAQNNTIDPSTLVAGLPPVDPGYGLLPTVNIANLQKIFSTGSSFNHQHTIQIDDNLSILKGRHNIKVGGQFLAEAESGTTYNTGSFSFSGRYTGEYQVSGVAQQSNAVNSFADFLLGYLDSDSTANADFKYRVTAKSYALYGEDSWNATPKLTVVAGIRYDKLFPFQVTRGGLSTFDPGIGSLVVIRGTPSPAVASAYPIVMGSSIDYNESNWMRLQNLNFAPRIGIAYRPWMKKDIVVRSGFGIFYDNLSLALLANSLGNQLPFVLSTSYTNPSNTVPSLTFADPFPTGGTIPANPNAVGVARNIKTPYNTQWNLSVEGESWEHVALRASYIGNLGTHLHTPFPLNQIVPQPIGVPGAKYQTTQAAAPFQPFAGITYYTYGESTNTNQLQLGARRRFSGLTFDAEYQFTRALGIDGPNDESVTNARDIRHDYGNLDFYARHELSLNYGYSLPVGTGQWLAGSAGPWLNRLIGGWQLTGVWKAASGTPFSVGFNSSINGLPSGRANLVPGAPLYPSTRNYHHWFNAGAFAPVLPPNYAFGNSQRNMMYGPGFSEWDAGVLKNIKLAERVAFEFRASAFDVLNRTNFGGPAANISNTSNVGIIGSTSGDNRELQFGGRISF